MTQFLLDSGDITEDLEIQAMAKSHDSEIWGATTNPKLIAKILHGQKLTSQQEAFSVLQKHIVENIVTTLPGAVSAEVYADASTTPEEMIRQGEEIATWHERIMVKLPMTRSGLIARGALRKKGIGINMTLVFSQQQIFTLALHEILMTREFGVTRNSWPCFISPFIGRLDDQGEDGLSLLHQATIMLATYLPNAPVWLLASSIRNPYHILSCIQAGIPLITAPMSVYTQWFDSPDKKFENPTPNLKQIPQWKPSVKILSITTVDDLLSAIDQKDLDITHPLTDAGLAQFVASWQELFHQDQSTQSQ